MMMMWKMRLSKLSQRWMPKRWMQRWKPQGWILQEERLLQRMLPHELLPGMPLGILSCV
jgi:predicted SprT family Zn-dependent metalloprotease